MYNTLKLNLLKVLTANDLSWFGKNHDYSQLLDEETLHHSWQWRGKEVEYSF
jgi:hypothetical protein